MLVFLDFEASSLGKKSYPIEVGWMFEDGRAQDFLIRPAPAWTDWDAKAAAIHGIARDDLFTKGTPHDVVAQTMIDTLSGHDLLASAPSWDSKWLSALLRAAGHPRHTLRLRDSDDAHRDAATSILTPHVAPERLASEVDALLTLTEFRVSEPPAHRALADAEAERQRWIAVRDAASARAAELQDD